MVNIIPKKLKEKISEALRGESFKEQSFWDKCEKISTGNHSKIVKHNIKPYKLLEWFAKQYPKEILQIKIEGDEIQ